MGCLSMPNYWNKIEEKKDGLNVYRFEHDYYGINYLNNCVCPLCAEPMSENIIKNLEELKNKGPQIIRELRKNYCDLVNETKYNFKKEDIDIFNKLEEIQIQIDDYLNQYENNKYFKYKCEKKNSECYLMLYNLPKEKIFVNDRFFKYNNSIKKEYEFSQWKNDENLKKTLLKEREEIFFKNKLKDIHNEIYCEWKKITFNMEYNKYLEIIKNFNQRIEYLSTLSSNFGDENDLMRIFVMYSYDVKYVSTKEKLKKYLAKFAIDEAVERTILFNNIFCMTKEEEKEYEIFEKENLEKYLNEE